MCCALTMAGGDTGDPPPTPMVLAATLVKQNPFKPSTRFEGVSVLALFFETRAATVA
jgi:hypothetical protein